MCRSYFLCRYNPLSKRVRKGKNWSQKCQGKCDDLYARGMISGSIKKRKAVDCPDFGATSPNFWHLQDKNYTIRYILVESYMCLVSNASYGASIRGLSQELWLFM